MNFVKLITKNKKPFQGVTIMKNNVVFAIVLIVLGVFIQSCESSSIGPDDSWEANKPEVASVVSNIQEYYYTDWDGEDRYQYVIETDITLKVRNRTDRVGVEKSNLWLETQKRGVTDILMQTNPGCTNCDQPWITDNTQIKQFTDRDYTIKVYSWVEQQPLGGFGYSSLSELMSDTTLTLKLVGVTINGRFNYKFPVKINGKNEKVEVSYLPEAVH